MVSVVADIENDVRQYCESVNYVFEEKVFPDNKILHHYFSLLHAQIISFRECLADLSRIIRLSLPPMSKGHEHGEKVQAEVLTEFAGTHFSAKMLSYQMVMYHGSRVSYVKQVCS